MERILKILKILTLILACVVLTLTILAFLKSKNNKVPSNETKFEIANNTNKKILFSDIGTLRAKTKDDVTIVIAVYFEYNENDIPFQEELVKKKNEFRKIILDFFSEHKINEINNLGEENIKEIILKQVNKKLLLNEIDTIYFEKFIVFE